MDRWMDEGHTEKKYCSRTLLIMRGSDVASSVEFHTVV